MKMQNYGPTVLRLVLGFLFIIPGITKLMNPSGIIGLLGNLGFPAATFFGWLLLLSEIIFGIAILVGYKTRYTVWPLIIVFAVVVIIISIPQAIQSPSAVTSLLFHLLGIAVLVSLFLTGPGALAIGKKMH